MRYRHSHRGTEYFYSFTGLASAANICVEFINIWFRLAGELRCKSYPCDFPLLHPSMDYALRASLWLFKFDPVKFVGSASQHKFIPDEFVFACSKKSNQKQGRLSFRHFKTV